MRDNGDGTKKLGNAVTMSLKETMKTMKSGRQEDESIRHTHTLGTSLGLRCATSTSRQ